MVALAAMFIPVEAVRLVLLHASGDAALLTSLMQESL
jgi:hypothetical protein